MDTLTIFCELDTEWLNIQKGLGAQWAEFEAQCRTALSKLPEDLTEADEERLADDLCHIMDQYEYTRLLLRMMQSPLERGVMYGNRSFHQQDQPHQYLNRLRERILKLPEQNSPDDQNVSDENVQGGDNPSDVHRGKARNP